jgi:hypothetical protein
MQIFNEIKNKFIHTQNEFNTSVKDNVGSSINDNSLQPIAQSINSLSQIEQNVKVEMMHIDKLLLEARTILPRI